MKYDLRERQECLNIDLLQMHWCVGEVNALTATQSLNKSGLNISEWFHLRLDQTKHIYNLSKTPTWIHNSI